MVGRGGRLKREGPCVYTRLSHVVVQQKLTQHCEAVTLQFLKNKIKRNCYESAVWSWSVGSASSY